MDNDAFSTLLSEGLTIANMSKYQGYNVYISLVDGTSIQGIFCVVWEGESGKSKPIACGIMEHGDTKVMGLLWKQIQKITIINEA